MSLVKPQSYEAPYVSAVEMGVAVRIVFDVRLRTTNAKMSAAFGIADLAAALARDEATVEVSYEIVGTVLDLLLKDAIIFSSLSEHLDAMEKFHHAVVAIRDAWHDYAVQNGATVEVKVDEGDKTLAFAREKLFRPDEIAYYIDGFGVGDTFLHLENAEVCHDLKALEEHYQKVKSMTEIGGPKCVPFGRSPRTEIGRISGT